MSTIAEKCGDLRLVRPALPSGRWILLVALLVAELLAITNRYDLLILESTDVWWAQWIGRSRHYLGWSITGVAAVLLFRGETLWGELRRLMSLIRRYRGWWVWLPSHVAALAVFAGLTGQILDMDNEALASATGWFLAWTAAAAAAAVFWALALLPARVWFRLAARHGAGVLLIGVSVGGVAWGAGHLARSLWPPMAWSTLWIVAGILRVFSGQVDCLPARYVVGTPSFHVEILPQCSGYEGVGLILVLLVSYLWLYRRQLRFPWALWLLPIGTAVIFVANALRIAALVLIGSAGYPQVAVGGFHSQAGWLTFNAVGLGLVAVMRRSRFLALPEATEASRPASAANPTAAYLGPLLALVVVMMIGAAFSASSGFDRFYALRVLAAGAVLWHYRRAYHDLRWSWSWAAVAIGAAVFALWMALEPLFASGDSSATADGLAALPRGWAVAWLCCRVVGSVVVVPVAEELAFRGFLLRRLIAAEFTDVAPGRFSWPSFLISSVLFGLLHGRWLAGTLAGLLYAGALYRRRELSDAVLAHATTNALIAAWVLATGSWSLWS